MAPEDLELRWEQLQVSALQAKATAEVVCYFTRLGASILTLFPLRLRLFQVAEGLEVLVFARFLVPSTEVLPMEEVVKAAGLRLPLLLTARKWTRRGSQRPCGRRSWTAACPTRWR